MFGIRQHFFKLIVAILIAMIGSVSNAFAGKITNLRIGQGVTNVRIVFEADSDIKYNVFTLSDPRRLVVDVKDIDVAPAVSKNKDENVFVENIRVGAYDVNNVRIAFDLKQPVLIKKVFVLPPNSGFNWRFVIDLDAATERDFISKLGNHNSFSSENYSKDKILAKNNPVVSTPRSLQQSKRKIIVLDAGHGGVDPGAIGYRGTYEKKITMEMARELKDVLEKNSKYKVYMTRNRDVFIPLRDRVKIARKYDADLFISIHADSARNRKAKGLSVYTLSQTASDKEAEALAEKENKADIVAGLNFADHTKEVSDILISLAQRETNNSSSEFANFLSSEMSKSVRTVSNTHRSAGFAVLKAPDVPSVLLELGYLSNPEEEKLLRQKKYRKKLADITVKAINKFFQNPKH